MNRLYLLGALTFSQVVAYSNFGTTAAKALTNTQYGSATYTATGDCFSAGTATPLGMNNIYYQYYSFPIASGSNTYTTVTITDPATPTAISPDVSASSVTGCIHEHMYNWMAQPQIGSSTVLDGLGDAVVAYGYVMGGSTLAACTLTVSAVTTTLYDTTTKVFTGGRFQYINAIITDATSIVAVTTASPVLQTTLSHYGSGALYTAATVTVQAFITITALGAATVTSSNAYYDFAQQQVFQGQTQFGRGGGATTAPCGWWVFYAYEAGVDSVGGATKISTWNLAATWSAATVHMWTDNAMVNTIGAFTLAALAALY